MNDDIIHDIGSVEDETNEFYHKWLDRKAEVKHLSNQIKGLEEALIAKDARIAELEARLEMDHCFEFDEEKQDVVRVEISPEDRSFDNDGISCRDATIKLQDDRMKAMRSVRNTYGRALRPFAKAAEDHMQEHETAAQVGGYVSIEDNAEICVPITFGECSRARAALEGKDND